MTQKILILNLTRMGDLIQTTPLVQGLRQKYPDAQITLMVSSDFENAISLIVNGFCKDVFKELPMEFAVEAQKLMEVSLEGAVG